MAVRADFYTKTGICLKSMSGYGVGASKMA